MKDTILFTSNCFGEDRSAALIARELKKLLSEEMLDYRVMGASLISEAEDYKRRGIDVLYSSSVPPSGGFPTRSIIGFFSDLFSNAIGNTLQFIKTIRAESERIRITVVVGDVTLLWLTRRALKHVPILFLAPAKSDYIEPHYKIEESYIRGSTDILFTHDQFTADNLKAKGLKALFLGNPMMDELEPAQVQLPLKSRIPTVGILPGSREEAYANFVLILKVAEMLMEKRKVNFVTALPGTLTDELIISKSSGNGWNYSRKGDSGLLKKGECEVILARGVFPAVLDMSDIIIGLAGTANEQAAGLGKPIVSFVGSGPQTTRDRIVEQARLLGDAMKYIPDYPDGVVAELVSLLDDPKERKRRGDAGVVRMGPAGGAKNIAEYVLKNYLRQ